MEPKEKYEQLLEEQSQKLKRELNKYKTMINIANILIMPINDKKRYRDFPKIKVTIKE